MNSGILGQTVSHYRVLEPLGEGGMGVVYRAEDVKLGRPVALKFLGPGRTPDRQMLERFLREARTASALNHPNICTIYEIDEHDGAPFIAMELIEGQTLERTIDGRPLCIDQLIDHGIQICEALAAAHSRGILHRDIKPANIFVNAREQVKVLDFGLAKSTAPRASFDDARSDAVTELMSTRAGVALGTIAYMSPEQARGEELDARSDLFSLGLVLYVGVVGVASVALASWVYLQSSSSSPVGGSASAAPHEADAMPVPLVEPSAALEPVAAVEPGPSTSAAAAMATPTPTAAGGGSSTPTAVRGGSSTAAPASPDSRRAPAAPASAAPPPVPPPAAAAGAAPADPLLEHISVARAKLDAKLYDQAVADVKTGLVASPTSSSARAARLLLGRIMQRQGRPEDAMAAYVELRSRHGGSSEAVEGTFLLADLRRYELAGQAWFDLARKFPNHAGDAAWRAGELFERRVKDPQRAREGYALVPPRSSRDRDAQKKLQP